jgi:hypothetical protein
MAKEVAEKKEFTTSLSQWSNEITGLIARDYESCGVKFDDYSKKCAMEAMTAIYTLVKNDGKVNMSNLDASNLRGIVERCASLKLNANAFPRECYFQIRNVKVGSEYVKTVEMGIEGAGNDAILTNYGKDVAKVYPYWIVKDGDTYIPPKHRGIEITPPEWEEKGLSQKTVRVVYPVKLNDGTITYLSAERDSVKVNLFAHVRNNLMNETFGICESRYKASDKQKKEIEERKEIIYEALRKCETVDDMLQCAEARPYMSVAWLDTPESMIVRKMCNNATKKYPKNYDTMANKAYMEMDETYQQVQEEIRTNANSVEFIEHDISENANKEDFVVADVEG